MTPGDTRAPSASILRSKLRVEDLEVAGRRVLVRADFNVPVDAGEVTDPTRIVATLPTLRHLLAEGAAVVAMSHRGRPGGERDPEDDLAPVAAELRRRLDVPVDRAGDCIGEEVERQVADTGPGRLLLLENLRFHPGEKANDPGFAAAVARLGELYVNDAFGACHRHHASIVGVPRRLRPAAAGMLLQREVERLSHVLEEPRSPFVLVLGGAKVEDKVGVIGNLLPLVDRIVIGGAMANAFLAAGGRSVGASLAPAAAIASAREISEQAAGAGVEIHLPNDFVVAPSPREPEQARVVEEIPDGEMALDIGSETRERFAGVLADARTVVWNGPMGVFETAAFAGGSRTVAKAIAGRDSEAYAVLGGGDTAAAAAAAGITDRVDHVSTGGGASLDLLAGVVLPGIAALTDRS